MPVVQTHQPLTLCWHVSALQAFRDTRGSDPSLDSSGDREVLLQLKEEVAARHGVASDIIPQEFTRWD